MFKKLWLSITGIWWGLIYLLNGIGLLQTAKDMFDNKGRIVNAINAIVAWQWLPLTLFVIGVAVLVFDRLGWIGRKPKTDNREHPPQALSPDHAAPRFRIESGPTVEASHSTNIWGGGPVRFLHPAVWVSSTVTNCKAYLVRIERGDEKWPVNEQLTFSPSESHDSLAKTLHPGIEYTLDVLVIRSGGGIHVCNEKRDWRRWPRLGDIFSEPREYLLTVAIAGDGVNAQNFFLRFDWTGNWQTSWLTLEDPATAASSRIVRRSPPAPEYSQELLERARLAGVKLPDPGDRTPIELIDQAINEADSILAAWIAGKNDALLRSETNERSLRWLRETKAFVEKNFAEDHLVNFENPEKIITPGDRFRAVQEVTNALNDYPIVKEIAFKRQVLVYFREGNFRPLS